MMHLQADFKSRPFLIQVLSKSVIIIRQNLWQFLFVALTIVFIQQLLEFLFYKNSEPHKYSYSDIFHLPLFTRVTYRFNNVVDFLLNSIGAFAALILSYKSIFGNRFNINFFNIKYFFILKYVLVIFIFIIFIQSLISVLFNIIFTILYAFFVHMEQFNEIKYLKNFSINFLAVILMMLFNIYLLYFAAVRFLVLPFVLFDNKNFFKAFKISKISTNKNIKNIFYLAILFTVIKSFYYYAQYIIFVGDEDNLFYNIIFQFINQMYISFYCIVNVVIYFRLNLIKSLGVNKSGNA